jgi:internalin A
MSHDNDNASASIERAKRGRWTVLNLSRYGIAELPRSIGTLNKLRSLHLQHNNLRVLPSEIKHVRYLQTLNLSYNRLEGIPTEVHALTDLEILNLSHNHLDHLPSDIGFLSHLVRLDLSGNRLQTLPTEIGQLTKLTELNLSGNPLTSLPDTIANLTSLKSLDLGNTRVDTLPPGISQLSHLMMLSLRNTPLAELPTGISALHRLRHLEVDGTQLISPPPEILQQGTDAILAFLQNLQTAGSERFEAKILLLGQGGVGKSSILRSLRGQHFQSNEDTTRGVDVARLELPHPSRTETLLNLNVWDFAGQDIEHATHQFFMSSKCVYLLVWNARHGYVQGRLDYWLEMIKSRAPETSVLLVATHVDQRAPDINFDALQKTYPQLVGQYAVDNYSGAGIETLRQAVAESAAMLPLMGQPWPDSWQAIEDDLKDASEHHITFDQFVEICDQYDITSERDIGALAETLHTLGIILHFGDDPSLRHLVILKPNWITKAISHALTDIPTGKSYGRLEHTSLPRIWRDYDPKLYAAFFSLMNKFELCYQIEDADDLSLIPALLSYAPPPIPTIPSTLAMIYRLSSVPPGLMSRFIVRTHRFTHNTHWREGVVLHYDGQFAKAELFEHQREFHLTIHGSSPTNFFAILTDTLDRILTSFPGLGVERRLPCLCGGDDTNDSKCSYLFTYEDVVRRKEKGKTTIECNKTLKEVPLNRLLYGIHESSQSLIRQDVLRIAGEPVERYRQVILLGQRGIVQNYNRLDTVDSRCPNTFVLSPAAGKKLELQLLCQSSDGWHFASDLAAYEIADLDETRSWIAPLILESLPLLQHVVPLSGLDISLRSKTPSRERHLFHLSVGFMQDFVATAPMELNGPVGIRESLRHLNLLLDHVDRAQTFGGLRMTTTPDGLRRWLCPFHYAQYLPVSLPVPDVAYRAFLCHNSKEKRSVREVARFLQQSGISYWFDEERILGGDRWQDALARGLRESACSVVFIGEQGWGDWQIEELQMALDLAAGKRMYRVIPLLLPPLRKVPDNFPSFLRNRHAIVLPSLGDTGALAKLAGSITAG